jgi:hypothetical protein
MKSVISRSLSTSIFVVLTLALLAVLPCFVVSSSTSLPEDNNPTGEDATRDQYIDLDGMSNEELEEICTSRGFQLDRGNIDDVDDIAYGHQYYVDAARECLQIETEM